MDQRMVIPMFDDDNRFVGMMTRTLDPNDPIKYKWESPNSRKAHWLYGIPQALKRPLMVNGRRTVFVVEGTLDVLHATECGFPVVASQTNRLSADQVQQLVSNWDLVLLIPDNDEPGKNLVKDAKKLVAPFLEVGVVILPKGVKDLDEMPTLDLPAFLNTAISEWRTTWQIAPRRQRSFLTLNPSVSAVLALEQSAKLSGICAIA
jgi:DNA primase